MLRRLKSDQNALGQRLVELPPRTTTVHTVEFAAHEHTFYQVE
jgi:hypothetical protein